MKKSQEEFTFKKHGSINIEEIKQIVSLFDDEWFIDTSRQQLFEVHKKTVSYIMTDMSLGWGPGIPFSVNPRYPESKLWKLVLPIITALENLHEGTVGKVLFPKLLAHSTIPLHVDEGYYLDVSRRHHIPIITNELVTFTVGDDTVSMNEGECWEINNMKPHSVTNNSDQERVHLLIDIVPNAAK